MQFSYRKTTFFYRISYLLSILHDSFSGGEPWGSKSWKFQNYSEPDRELVCPPWAGIPKTIQTFLRIQFTLAALGRRFGGS